MSNPTTIVVACLITAIAAICITMLYVGFRTSFQKAKVGAYYSFDYLQPNTGETLRHAVKVLEVQNLTESEIRRLEAKSKYRENDSLFHRGNTLVRTVDKAGNYRQFYAHRCVNCRRLPLGRFIA